MIGVGTDFTAGHFADLCRYVKPSGRSACTANWGRPNLSDDVDVTLFPLFKNLAAGDTAIDGDRALVGFTSTVCVLKDSPSCFTNHDPAAILDSGKSFSVLWARSLKSFTGPSANTYFPIPAIRVSGHWYAYSVDL